MCYIQLPDCFCSPTSTKVPGNLDPATVPQVNHQPSKVVVPDMGISPGIYVDGLMVWLILYSTARIISIPEKLCFMSSGNTVVCCHHCCGSVSGVFTYDSLLLYLEDGNSVMMPNFIEDYSSFVDAYALL